MQKKLPSARHDCSRRRDMNNQFVKKEKVSCSVCGSRDLQAVLELPAFPLTSIYIKDPAESADYPNVDQALMLCLRCGHGQLRFFLEPDFVYGPLYWHRSSASPIATSGNDFFAEFLGRLTAGKAFRKIVEVGCNDLYLLRKIAAKGDELFGIDPIWKQRQPPAEGNIRVIGKFIEEVDFQKEIGGAPDLVLSVHTFEHVDEPKEPLRRLMEVAAPGALFVIEVPGFDTLLEISRFDQVFHQHVQYFSLASMERLIGELGGEYVTHTFNYGYWGGTMLVAFQKPRGARVSASAPRFSRPTPELVAGSLASFCEEFSLARKALATLHGERVYGYGGAQMLPTIAYHLKSDLSFFECVLDDNPDRDGLRYPHLSAVIRKPADDFSLEGASVLVTALDSARGIVKRAIELKAKRIIMPLRMF